MNRFFKYFNLSQRIKDNIYKCKTFYQLNMAKLVTLESDKIIWIDLEMTGIEYKKNKILEFASIITDDELNIISDEFEIVINQPDSVLMNMDPWCLEQHGKTGLTSASQQSPYDEKSAEDEILKFLEKYVKKNTCPVAGNSIWLDKLFIKTYLPRVNDYVGDDIIDVSSINELVKRWNKKIEKKKARKNGNHRALGDIRDSIKELQYYKSNIFEILKESRAAKN